ncbi:hypothetical protein GS941_26135 [Rhodococcus hoagii]|nr:hypothetical protein [Prescottella equi]
MVAAQARSFEHAYHVPFVVELVGELSEEALRDALGDVLRRHAPLRTVLTENADGNHGRVSWKSTGPLCSVPECAIVDEKIPAVDRRLRVSEPSTSRADVPIRFALTESATGVTNSSSWRITSLATDSRSRPLIADLTAAYTRATRRRDARVGPSAGGLRGLPRWQHELLDSGIRDSDARVLEGVLEGAPAVPGVPLESIPVGSPRPRGAGHGQPRQLRLTALGTVPGASTRRPSWLLHSAVAVLLSAITGTPDTLLGTAESAATIR